MLNTFGKNFSSYGKSRWGKQIFIWSSVVIFMGAVGYAVYLGLGSETGHGAASQKFLTVVAVVLAVPALIVFNVAMALLWAIVSTLVNALRG
mgnify:CR=1 FL=1